MSAATDRPARTAQRQRTTIGLDVGKALGPLDGIGRYTRGLLAGLAELEAGLPGAERFDYVLFPLFRCERVIGDRELLAATGFGADDSRDRVTFAAHAAPRPGEVDLFHATAWAVPADYRGRLALTLYDFTFLTLADAHTEENRAHCMIGLARALARGGALCAISRSVREDAADRLGIDAAAVAVAPPGVAAGFAAPPAEVVERTRIELGIDRPYVLALGTLEPRKNVPRLLEAWALLPSELRAAHRLVLAGGEGWAGAAPSEPLERLLTRLGLGGEVRALGYVDDERLPALYAGASVFVYPSLGEGFGLPPVEAMACGVPVVASDRPALPEVLGDAAVLVDPESPARLASAIAGVLGDPDRARALRAAGLQRAGELTWRRTAESVRGVWQRRLERRAGAAS